MGNLLSTPMKHNALVSSRFQSLPFLYSRIPRKQKHMYHEAAILGCTREDAHEKALVHVMY